MKVTKLLMTFAYSVAAACCATAFSHLGDLCLKDANPLKPSCGNFQMAVVATTVIAFIVCFVMLAAWLLATELAAKFNPIASHLTLVILLIAVGLSSQAGNMIALGTIFVALVLSLLLTVYTWNEWTSPPEAPKASEPETVAA